MNQHNILTSEVIDIIFEHRNKQYGAYDLRKAYPARLKAALLIMLGLAAVFSAFSLWPDRKLPDLNTFAYDEPTLGEVHKDKKQPEKKTAPAKPKRPSAKLVSSFKIVANKDSSDLIHDVTHLAISNVSINTDSTDVAIFIDPGTTLGGGSLPAPPAPPAPEVDTHTPVDDPDIQASFPGGAAALRAFLERNLQVPPDLEAGETVQVRIRFVVGFDGKLQSFAVEKNGGEVYNEEVVRVLKKMPQWEPGKKGGRNVPVYYSLPVKFAAND